jgi:cobalt/nickel transport system ATP-binding protein
MIAPFEICGLTVEKGGRRVLDGLDLTLRAGERVALVGGNGAGKTTLLRALVGLETLTAGRIVAFGQAVSGEAAFRPVRRRVGFLLQDADDQIVAPTVLEDVAFGPRNHGRDDASARTAARRMLDDLGLGALAGRATHTLSGGEKRLVALAGVLVLAPDVLLLDEPTNALDDAARTRLLAILSAHPAGLLVASHDPGFLLALTDRAVRLADGRLHAATIHRHPHLQDAAHLHGG